MEMFHTNLLDRNVGAEEEQRENDRMVMMWNRKLKLYQTTTPCLECFSWLSMLHWNKDLTPQRKAKIWADFRCWLLLTSVFLVTFAMEQSPGKKAIFLSESQFFKVRSDGYVAAALDCDKSHQTALTPSSMTSPMSPMSKCSWESIPWNTTWRRFSRPITKPVRPRTKTNLWHSLQDEEISGAGATSLTAQAGPVLPNLSLGAPRLVEKGIPENAFDLVRESPQDSRP